MSFVTMRSTDSLLPISFYYHRHQYTGLDEGEEVIRIQNDISAEQNHMIVRILNENSFHLSDSQLSTSHEVYANQFNIIEIPDLLLNPFSGGCEIDSQVPLADGFFFVNHTGFQLEIKAFMNHLSRTSL